MTPYIVEMGVVHHIIAPYTTEKSQSHRGFLLKSPWNFAEVTGLCHTVIAVSIAHIGVTTPCNVQMKWDYRRKGIR